MRDRRSSIRRRLRPILGVSRQGPDVGPPMDPTQAICFSVANIGMEPEVMEKTQTSSEPTWLDPRNDRNTPFTDGELDVLADDFIARMADTQAWRDLVAEVGEQQARQVVKQRLASQDANSLINWQPDGPVH